MGDIQPPPLNHIHASKGPMINARNPIINGQHMYLKMHPTSNTPPHRAHPATSRAAGPGAGAPASDAAAGERNRPDKLSRLPLVAKSGEGEGRLVGWTLGVVCRTYYGVWACT